MTKKKILIIAAAFVAVIAVLVCIILFVTGKDEHFTVSERNTLSQLDKTTAIYYIVPEQDVCDGLADFLDELEKYDRVSVTLIYPDETPSLVEALAEGMANAPKSGDMIIKYAAIQTETLSASELVSNGSFIGEDAVFGVFRKFV